MQQDHLYPPVQAIYIAGCLFSFGIRLTQIPFDLPPAQFATHLFVAMILSLGSWLAAGIALVPPP